MATSAPLSQRVDVVEAAVVLAEVFRALAPVGLTIVPDDGRATRSGIARIADRLTAHVTRPLDAFTLQKHHAAVGVQEAAEPDDRLAARRVLRQMQRLRHGDVESTRDDLFFGFPVVGRLDERHVEAGVREIALLQRDDQWQMIWVKEPLEADLDGHQFRFLLRLCA